MIDILSIPDNLSCVTDDCSPLKAADARQLAREIARLGDVGFTDHALDEMAKDDLETTDCLNLLRAGVFNPPEWENGEYRYRVETARMCIMIAFESRTALIVVTAWRKNQ